MSAQTSALHDPVAAAVHAAAAQVADKIVGDAWAMALKLGRQRDRRVLQDLITTALEKAMAPRITGVDWGRDEGENSNEVICNVRGCRLPGHRRR